MVPDHVDVLIITALLEELSAVLALGEAGEEGWTETRDRSGMPYHVREFTNAHARRFVVAAACSGEMGEAEIMMTERLIDELDPACLAVCGICAGKRGEVFLGDVIVADRIFSYDESGDIFDKSGPLVHDIATYNLEAMWQFTASELSSELDWSWNLVATRPKSLDVQKRWFLDVLLEHELNLGESPKSHPDRRERCPDWEKVLKRLRYERYLVDARGVLQFTPGGRERAQEEQLLNPDGFPGDPPFRVHVGPLAATTTPMLDRHPSAFDRLKRYHRRTLGIDSESSTLVQSVMGLGKRGVVVKAVADYADEVKDDLFRAFACRASAEFLLFFLQNRFEPEERQVRSSSATLKNVSLDRIVIRNFKNIHHLEIPFATPSELPGHWTCIAGLNGAGKSAVLQAIALVLLGDRLAPVIGDEWLKRARRTVEGLPQSAEIRAWVRSGQELMEVALHMGDSGINPSRLEAEPAYAAMRSFWAAREQGHLLLSYGAGRNLSEYRDSRHATKSEDVRRQMTLFDPLTQVAGVEVLLEQGERARQVLAMLKRLLDEVFEGDALSVEHVDDTLRFRVGGATVAATELPDGFRATVAWLADLCAAWHAKAPEEAKDGDPSKIRAIVLIDEIDLHLHAALQRILVPRLRKALPEVQWVVTTHSPLVVSSFDSRELVVLDAGPEGPVKRELDRQILAFSTDEVYRWLMGVPPHSAALDEVKPGNGAHEARLTAMLAHSPKVSEAEAEADREWLEKLAQRFAQSRAEDEPKKPS
ncbi:MAG TPA: AAA family ATPase [Hyalangium sp.]|jgi:nucleoside phosphorylase|nr:AAA family ATPase [Hyalangium sp.]